MAEIKATRLSKAARDFNVGIATIVEFLHKKGHTIDPNPNTKMDPELYELLVAEYSSDQSVKKESEKLILKTLRDKKETITINDVVEEEEEEEEAEDSFDIRITDNSRAKVAKELPREKAEEPVEAEKKPGLKVVGKIDLDKPARPAAEPAAKQSEPETPVAEEETAAKAEDLAPQAEPETVEAKTKGEEGPKVIGKIDLDNINQRTRPIKKSEKEKAERQAKQEAAAAAKAPEKPEAEVAPKPEAPVEPKKEKVVDENMIPTRVERLAGPTVVGKIDLPVARDGKKKPVASSKDTESDLDRKKKRKRIRKEGGPVVMEEDESGAKKNDKGGKKKKRVTRPEVSEEDVQKQIKDTLAKLTTKGKSKGSKHRRDKREAFQQRHMEEVERLESERNILKVTEFVTVSELSSMMDIPPTELIRTCMNLGQLVSINQRLDAEIMAILAEEFGFKLEFISVEVQEAIHVEEDHDDDLQPRPPIVTVMGHVDHGKTKLLDYIRSANVVEGEAGGITQHIGAYSFAMEDGRSITFLDTPGHEAFTAMRARGAQITDVAIIVVAADDGVMPQTVEAINHAAAAGVPIVFAINKIDKPTANPEKIKEELAGMNYLVEDWGGKFQSQEISAKTGLHVGDLLEKVLLEAELLDLKANPEKRALGTVIESALDKGRGYISTILIEAGTLRIGDVLLAGHHFGHVKAMFNERGKKINEAGPSTPVQILGLNGAPQAGDRFNVMESDKEAKEIANKREQLQREQETRTRKHITLDEIGRRIAIGNFQELNLIVKGDVDGSVEALSDSLIKLSTPEIQVNIKHKAVGQISESDVLLAAASNAIVVGFQVRPSLSARRLAEKEQIDIRLYSIIYDAIEEVKLAMEGMLSPEIKEEITATLEVLSVFKITKVGTVAGCIVREGKIKRTSKVRLIREGIVLYSGDLGSLQRFKDDAREVVAGLECGLNIKNFNDIKVGDMVEAYEETEIRKKL
ncbi:MAG: translation initiation factor IF-2 [Bacteroidota bacterium]